MNQQVSQTSIARRNKVRQLDKHTDTLCEDEPSYLGQYI